MIPNLTTIPANVIPSRVTAVQTASRITAIPAAPLAPQVPKAQLVREVLQVRRVFPAQEARLARKDLRG